MPFLTEELWAIKGADGPARNSLLVLADWPALNGFAHEGAEAEIGWMVDLISEIRSVRSEMNVPASSQMPLVLVGASAEMKARAERGFDTLKRLARVSDLSFSETPPSNSAQVIVRGALVALPLEGIIDISAEKVRLEKEIVKLDGEVKKIDAKLANADFVARAPEEVVEENRDRRTDAVSRIEKMSAALKRLS
jgi:valyl-tRNA synthetase